MNKISQKMQTGIVLALCLFLAGCGKKAKPQEAVIHDVHISMPEGKAGLSDVSDEGKSALDELASKFFDKEGSDHVLVLRPYASGTGSVAGNQKISNERLSSVKKYLIEAGVPAASIVVIPTYTTDAELRGVRVIAMSKADADKEKARLAAITPKNVVASTTHTVKKGLQKVAEKIAPKAEPAPDTSKTDDE